ncbi:MAG: hypothetical protein RBT46_03095 [Weeksellaceae bacterium]|jgi:uncharacterized protein YcfL|nr:hypothetical protein [Weeksellaceae bacterium]MDX9704674.1 hypothetical protein [Weeksellaceae bacterium]
MKKLSLLIVGTFLLVACDATPGGNKAILPVVHDTDTTEVVEETIEVKKENSENMEAAESTEALTEETETAEAQE